jgi:copper oxidase (laccase) domain-containing protein
VGDEVRETFVATDEAAAVCFEPNDRGRWQADLYGLARLLLTAVGVTEVYGGGFCTFADPDRFFSYRRDGSTGRMVSYIYRL